MSQENASLEPRWYVVHTYSGHENKVKATIEKAVKTRGMEAAKDEYFKEKYGL